MADLLKAWLRTRLGVIMDLTPEMFGHYTRDGTLLAQILHSYDIISNNQLSTIVRTQDPALSRVNLKTLRIWLKLVNVTLSDECIEEISIGKGAAALQLFYKVYLSLEGKDRLHFIALQKEREKYTPISSRFDVSRVSEEPAYYHPPEHALSKPLIAGADTILWHREKFWRIVEACRRERRRFEATEAQAYPMDEPAEYFVPEDYRPDAKKEESERLDEFAHRHPARKTRRKYRVVECCPAKRYLDVPAVEDPAAAAEYVGLLKKRSGRATECQELKLKTQTSMMTEAWERLLRKQDRSFDEALGRRVLDQSRYEKQMMRKLCEVRNVRSRIVENRRIVDALLLTARETEQRLREDRRRETAAAAVEEVVAEGRRMRELRRRLRDEKARRVRERHRAICAEVAQDLADIAVKAADCRRATSEDRVSRTVWSEWRTLFLTGQPVYELARHFDEIEDLEVDSSEGVGTKNEVEARNDRMTGQEEEIRNIGQGVASKEEIRDDEKRRLIQLELARQRVLADADFENYRNLASPWDEFAPRREEVGEEMSGLGRVVLGYVVHRLLGILYPCPTVVAICPVPRVNVRAVVLGVTGGAAHEQLREELLRSGGVRPLRIEDAINHCLEMYKREMADVEYIDLNIVAATARDARRLEVAKSKTDDSQVERRAKRQEGPATKAAMPRQSEEKQTQTPKAIPYDDMDPVLSDAAYIGKWTYEFLTLGQPISNELSTKILIEYLKGIGEVEGWALINYPNTYEQMAMLEKAFTGQEVPSERKAIDFTDVNIEDIDPPSPRIVFESGDIDTSAISRQSRLLPNPTSREKDRRNSSTTFVTMYVRAILKPKTLGDQAQSCIPLPDDATAMDRYYAEHNIAYGFYYTVLDPPTVRKLAGLVAGDRSAEAPPVELFRETYNGEKGPPDDAKAAVIKRWLPRSEGENSQRDAKRDVEVESRDLQSEPKMQLAASPAARPGEAGWQWLDLPQSPVLLESLAALWENAERAYVENLKQLLSSKRVHTSAVVPYGDLVLRNLTKFVDRPDKRQELLYEFHRAFNEIDEDLREDLDMKCELHCRVADFRAELWELCDARRREAEEETGRALRNQWVPVEAATLVNVYTGILQTEADRFVDTVQLLQDYYTSMSQKPVQESRFSKVLLDLVELGRDDSRELSGTLDERVQGEEERTTRPEESIEVSARGAAGSNAARFATEIEALLADVSMSFDPERSGVCDAIEENVRRVRGVVDAVSSTIAETLKREEKIAATAKLPDVKGRGAPDSASPDSTLAKLARRGRDLVEEWRYAVSYEIDRIRRRTDVLSAAARADVTFLLDTTRRTLHRVHRHIAERYRREIESVNEMADVFRFAVEEARPIRRELLLEGDRFAVRRNILMFPEDPPAVVPLAEAPSPLRFRMAQLARLLNVLRRVAPRGTLSERGLVYVLQDLVSCGEEDCLPPAVPCAWRRLRPPDIEGLIARLFGPDGLERVEWREFIVYAMDLPVPSHEDILRARAAFRRQDPESREMIERDRWRTTPLWFLERVGTSPDEERVLRERIPREDRDLFLDDDDEEEFLPGDRAFADSSTKHGLIETSVNDSSDKLRAILAKELLCRMYLVNRHAVNYTAMLLAFCKDEDPREGLGKAFTLAMGVRVCTDTAEGERYVEELVEQKRRVREMKLSRDYLRVEANEVAREIVSHLISKVEKGISVLEKRRSREHDLAPKRRVMIQRLDGFGEIDPADLLPPEVISEHLVIEDSSVISDDHEYEQPLMPPPSVASEDHERIQRDERVIFWLPRDVCLTVLCTCLPWHAMQADLFQSSLSLREGITRVYDELRNDELNDQEDVVLAHRLDRDRGADAMGQSCPTMYILHVILFLLVYEILSF